MCPNPTPNSQPRRMRRAMLGTKKRAAYKCGPINYYIEEQKLKQCSNHRIFLFGLTFTVRVKFSRHATTQHAVTTAQKAGTEDVEEVQTRVILAVTPDQALVLAAEVQAE